MCVVLIMVAFVVVNMTASGQEACHTAGAAEPFAGARGPARVGEVLESRKVSIQPPGQPPEEPGQEEHASAARAIRLQPGAGETRNYCHCVV
jgi:hypothetical protein